MSPVQVLVIDDDPEDCGLIRDLLRDARQATFTFTCAHSASEGLEQLQQNVYHVVLLDYKLPDRDGLSLLSEIRQQNPKLPIILVTSHGDRQLQIRAREAGAVDYLEKGLFSVEILERACLYAVQVYQALYGSPNVQAALDQYTTLSKQLSNALDSIGETLDNLDEAVESLRDDFLQSEKRLIERFDEKTWLKYLNWAKDNWKWALGALAAASFILVLLFFVIRGLDAEDIEKVRSLKGDTVETTP